MGVSQLPLTGSQQLRTTEDTQFARNPRRHLLRLRGLALQVGGAHLLVVEPESVHEQVIRAVVRHQRGIYLCGDDSTYGETGG